MFTIPHILEISNLIEIQNDDPIINIKKKITYRNC